MFCLAYLPNIALGKPASSSGRWKWKEKTTGPERGVDGVGTDAWNLCVATNQDSSTHWFMLDLLVTNVTPIFTYSLSQVYDNI